MPDFTTRSDTPEMMDDFSIVDARLDRALTNLRVVNRFLGGYSATMAALQPFMASTPERPLRLLDLATGAADFPAYLVRWAERQQVSIEVVGLDANQHTVEYARRALDEALPSALRARITVVVGDALALAYDDDAFDICVASLFLHHLPHEQAVTFLREMQRVARRGLLVNDLHRHPLAYYSISALATLAPVSPMFRHDGPLSVLRAFTRKDLEALATDAGLASFAIRWHWAFRWTLSTLNRKEA